jgi:hypothetical protein
MADPWSRATNLSILRFLVVVGALEMSPAAFPRASIQDDAKFVDDRRPAQERLAPPTTGWASHIETVDRALSARDTSAAVRAWHEARGVALASRGWEPMIAIGDAALRIGEVGPTRDAARANARQAYLAALLRARATGSAEGALRAAHAFEALGDQAVAAGCARIAVQMAEARRDVAELERVRTATRTLLQGPS